MPQMIAVSSGALPILRFDFGTGRKLACNSPKLKNANICLKHSSFKYYQAFRMIHGGGEYTQTRKRLKEMLSFARSKKCITQQLNSYYARKKGISADIAAIVNKPLHTIWFLHKEGGRGPQQNTGCGDPYGVSPEHGRSLRGYQPGLCPPHPAPPGGKPADRRSKKAGFR